MKTILIIIAIVFVLFKMLKSTKAYHEAILLADLRKNINNKSLLQGLTMNSIQSRAADELMNGKISEEFYFKMFCGGNAKTPWWEVNRKNIEG
jgi:hypothetical protein